ncbi:MAG: hypothetical protein AB8B91_12515 [Rubripirellula sp.]
MMQRTSDPSLHRLQQALETNASREDVVAALEAAESLGDQLPPLLAYRAKERIDAERFLGRRKIAFGVACSLFVFLCAISSVGLTTVMQLRSHNHDRADFQSLLDGESWEDAQAFLDSLDETTRSSQVFAEGQRFIDQQLELERARRAEFDELLIRLRASTGELDEELVSRINELARTEEEESAAAEMSARVDEQDLQQKANRVEGQTLDFQSLQKEVDRFFASESESLSSDARTARMQDLRQKLQQFVSDNHLSNPELSEAAKQTAALLVRENKRAQTQTEKQKLVDAITDSVGDKTQFLRQVSHFVRTFPDDSMSDALTELVENHKVMDATQAWIDVLDHPAFRQPSTAQSESAENWIAAIGHAESLQPRHPLSDQAMQWRASYAAIAKRDAAIKELAQMFADEQAVRLYRYPDGSGWIYSDMSPDRESRTPHVVEYFSDLALNRKTKNFGSRFQQQVKPRVKLAGHSVYANKASQEIVAMKEADFTPSLYRLISQLRTLEVGTEIDPILKVNWLRGLLRIGAEASEPLKAGFADWESSLQAEDFDWNANWMSPGDTDPAVVESRMKAISLLKSSTDWGERVSRMGESFRAFRSPRPEAPRWVGWVAEEGDQFRVQLSSASKEQLFVISQQPGSDQPLLVPLDSSGLIVDKTLQSAGDLVYTRGSTASSSTVAQPN